MWRKKAVNHIHGTHVTNNPAYLIFQIFHFYISMFSVIELIASQKLLNKPIWCRRTEPNYWFS